MLNRQVNSATYAKGNDCQWSDAITGKSRPRHKRNDCELTAVTSCFLVPSRQPHPELLRLLVCRDLPEEVEWAQLTLGPAGSESLPFVRSPARDLSIKSHLAGHVFCKCKANLLVLPIVDGVVLACALRTESSLEDHALSAERPTEYRFAPDEELWTQRLRQLQRHDGGLASKSRIEEEKQTGPKPERCKALKHGQASGPTTAWLFLQSNAHLIVLKPYAVLRSTPIMD